MRSRNTHEPVAPVRIVRCPFRIGLLMLAVVLTMVVVSTRAEAAEPTRLEAEDAVGAALAWSGLT